jgi:hypothetical protein
MSAPWRGMRLYWLLFCFNPGKGCAVAQAVSRRLPTTAARVLFVVDKAALGQVFQGISISPANSHSPPYAPYPSVIRGWYNRPLHDRRIKRTQSHHTIRIKKSSKRGFFPSSSRWISRHRSKNTMTSSGFDSVSGNLLFWPILFVVSVPQKFWYRDLTLNETMTVEFEIFTAV